MLNGLSNVNNCSIGDNGCSSCSVNFVKLLLYFFPLFTSSLIPLETKRLLMIIFPGGTSHHFVIQTLFNHTITHQTKYTYEYHILVHNIDIHNWKNLSSLKNYYIYPYGNVTECKQHLINSIEMFNKNPTFGFTNFNKGMIFHIKEFLSSDLISQLKHIKFDIIGSDIPTFIQIILANELNIKNKLYISPPSLPQLFYRNFELNPSYIPAIGATFSDTMSFKERIINYIYQTSAQIIFALFQYQQINYIKRNFNYNITTNNIHFADAINFIQYPLSIAFPISTPPNFILLNAITPKQSTPMNESEINIDKFLSKHKINIYISQGTIMNIINMNEQIKMFKHFNTNNNIGFILSMRQELLNELNVHELPKNVYVTKWVNQNDLLGDDRVKCFITHGGINSVSEAVYHNKPMIVLGVGLDQINTAAFVKKKRIGVTVQNKREINSNFLINAINDVISNYEVYVNRIKVLSKLMKESRSAKEEFQYWIDYGFENGYDNLIIDVIKNGNWFRINGYDIQLFFICLGYIIFLINKKVFLYWYGLCKRNNIKVNKLKYL